MSKVSELVKERTEAERREIEDEKYDEKYEEMEEWKKDSTSYFVGAYLFEKFQEEIEALTEKGENEDIIVYDHTQNRVYTVPPDAEEVSKSLIPLKIVKED